MSARRRLDAVARHLAPEEEAGQREAAHQPPKSHSPNVFLVDGQSMTPESLCQLGYNASIKLDLTAEAWNKVR